MFLHCKLLCYVQIMKAIFFNANWCVLTLLKLDLLEFFTLMCFWDEKINIITRIKDVTVVSRFDPRLVFSDTFFFVKIIHPCNVKPCFQIFFICLCPTIMGFKWQKRNLYERWFRSSADHSLWHAYDAYHVF